MEFISLPGFTVPCLVRRTYDLCIFSWPQSLTLAFLGTVYTCCDIPSVAFTTLIVPSCPSHHVSFLLLDRPILPHHVQLLVPPMNPRIDTVRRPLCCRICEMTLSSRPPESRGFPLSAAGIPSSSKHLLSPVVSLRPCPRHPPTLEALWSPTATSTPASFL